MLACVSQDLTYDSDDADAVWDSEVYTWDDEINDNSNNTMEIPITNVTYPVPEVIGFCQDTVELVNTYKTKMVANGNDPTAALALLAPAQTDLATQNGIEQGIKTQLRTQTPITEASRDKAYSYSSYLVDQVVSAFGRNSEIAQEAINLRKKLRPARVSKAAQAAKSAVKA